MLFNSLVFLPFLATVLGGYVLLRRHYRAQNALLLVASYFFYGWWDWRFLGLLALSTGVDFILGRKLHEEQDPGRRRLYLFGSVATNLTILGFFKYANFFAASLAHALGGLGVEASPFFLNVVLPVGISFYTFQSLSYTIDIYRREMPPTKSLLDFALYVAFFPQLVAGPIERAARLLPQISAPRTIRADQVNTAIYLIVWGYFQKVVVADNLAPIVNHVFDPANNITGIDVWLGAVAYAFQIYGDFAGYSNIARGIAKLFGFELMVNFRLPYFALNPSDFWSRWHISLSTWLRDYLYIPLGGNRGGRAATHRNLFLTMLLGGLWHGAAWPFVIWGAYHGLLLVAYRLAGGRGRRQQNTGPALRHLAQMALLFVLVLIGWIFFRAPSLEKALALLGGAGFALSAESASFAARLGFFVAPLFVAELFQHLRRDLVLATRWPVLARVALYGVLVVAIFVFGVREALELIYFQF